MGRGLKAVAVSLAVALGMTACSRDYTLAYLYVTSATRTQQGVVNAYAIDYQSGALQQLADSPIPAGNNPVALVAAPNGKTLYVANRNDSTIDTYAIGSDGKIYQQATTNVVSNAAGTIIGSLPTAVAIDPLGDFLFVTFSFQAGFTTARPGPGGLAIFPIMHSSNSAQEGQLQPALTNSTIGTTTALPYIPLGDNPSALVVAPNTGTGTAAVNNVYLVDQEQPGTAGAFGELLAFTVASAPSSSVSTVSSITQIAGGPLAGGGFAVGTQPAGIAVEPSNHFLYVTDQATNQLYAFQLLGVGVPSALRTSPYTTGFDPLGLTVDPRGDYVYVANFGSSTISAFAIAGDGSLSGAGGITTATGPTCVTIDSALGIYIYTSNNTDNSVSAQQLNPNTGALRAVQGTQYSAAALPTCAATVANGAHPTALAAK